MTMHMLFVAIETKTFRLFAFNYLFERFFKGKFIQENTCYQLTGKGLSSIKLLNQI